MRALCEGADEQGWSTYLHEAYSSVEKDEMDAATPVYQYLAREQETSRGWREAAGFCELFAGGAKLSGAMGRA
eukprot:1716591-Pyramimonas_sp.AAC.1